MVLVRLHNALTTSVAATVPPASLHGGISSVAVAPYRGHLHAMSDAQNPGLHDGCGAAKVSQGEPFTVSADDKSQKEFCNHMDTYRHAILQEFCYSASGLCYDLAKWLESQRLEQCQANSWGLSNSKGKQKVIWRIEYEEQNFHHARSSRIEE